VFDFFPPPDLPQRRERTTMMSCGGFNGAGPTVFLFLPVALALAVRSLNVNQSD
jgi:hypothetical protein